MNKCDCCRKITVLQITRLFLNELIRFIFNEEQYKIFFCIFLKVSIILVYEEINYCIMVWYLKIFCKKAFNQSINNLIKNHYNEKLLMLIFFKIRGKHKLLIQLSIPMWSCNFQDKIPQAIEQIAICISFEVLSAFDLNDFVFLKETVEAWWFELNICFLIELMSCQDDFT